MTVETTSCGRKAVICLSGKITGAESIRLSKTLQNYRLTDYDEVVIDFSNVEVIDSNGLGGLIYSQLLLEKYDKRIVLSAPNSVLRELFSDCNLDQTFKILEPREETAYN